MTNPFSPPAVPRANNSSGTPTPPSGVHASTCRRLCSRRPGRGGRRNCRPAPGRMCTVSRGGGRGR